jgi:arylsulfatase A-like enzyme
MMPFSMRHPRRVLALFAALGVGAGCGKKAPEQHDSAPMSTSNAEGASSAAPSASSTAVTSALPSAATPAVTPTASPAAPLNVLVITIDSLRADVPWLGYGRPVAPNLTRLAESSVVYTRAYSASSYTAKSLATLLSGRFASTLYRDGRFFARYAPSNRFFAEILHEHGVRTVAWHSHLYFGRDSGLEQGFDVWRLVPGIKFDPETDNDVTSDKMTALGIELLGDPKNTSGRFFAWGHYMDPHDQYQAHPEAPDFGKHARDRYDEEIWFTDHFIGKLLDWAESKAWWQNTVLIVTADHGEAFGEHGMYKHAFELWDVLTHVPLLVHGPGLGARRIDERRSAIDLAPTILELFGVEPPPDFQGKSMVAELRGAEPDRREPILLELAEDTHNPPRRALLQGNEKLIDFGHGHYELFDLAADPSESDDVGAKHPSELEAMKRALAAKYATMPTVTPYGGQKLHDGGRANGPRGPAERGPAH